MDIHVAERRRGGKHFVFDCKHYTVAKLQRCDVEQTINYKRSTRASTAVILVSAEMDEAGLIPASVTDYAEQHGVLLVPVDTAARGVLASWLRIRAMKKQLRDLR